jgi:hypothetical protein
MAILMVARQWTAQYEWYAHHRLAMQAGLDPKIAEDIANNRRPSGMKTDEEILYNFVRELLDTRQVSDGATRRRSRSSARTASWTSSGASGTTRWSRWWSTWTVRPSRMTASRRCLAQVGGGTIGQAIPS